MSSAETGDRRLGIVGAGRVGTTIARAAIAAGYNVVISGSGPAERIALIVEVLAPGAHAASTEEVVQRADLIVVAVPMHRFRDLPHDLFDGKILIDAMNYWEDIDGVDQQLATAPDGTSVVVQEWFPSARVVKSLNHITYYKFDARQASAWCPGPHRHPAAGDDRAAVAAVMQLIDRLGFDAVDARSLDTGLALEPNGAGFGGSYSAREMLDLLSPA